MNYKIVGWRILVKPDDIDDVLQENVSDFLKDSGFTVVVPEAEKKMVEKATVLGTVISVGDWAFKAYFRSVNGEKFESPVKEGDRITFARYCGEEWVHPDTEERYLVINDEDVQLVLERTTNG